MKVTLDLPGDLVRQIKVRAAAEGRKLKDLAADLLRKGMFGYPPSNESRVDPGGGVPRVDCAADAPIARMSQQEIYALIHKTQEEEDLERAGLPV